MPDERAVSSRGPRSPLRAFDALVSTMNAGGTLLIAGLAVLINADVIGRALWSRPLAGVPEIAGLAIVAIVFLQIAYCARGGYLTRSEALLLRLQSVRPAAAAALDGFHHLVGAALFAILAAAAWVLFRKAWVGNEFDGAPGVIMIPVWPVKLIVAVGAACMALQLLRMAVFRLRAAVAGGAAPITFGPGGDL